MSCSSESPVSSIDDGLISAVESDASLSDGDHSSESEENNLLDLSRLRTRLGEEDRKLIIALKAAKTSGDNFDEERLNIEKTILSTSLAMKQLNDNFKKMFELNCSNECRIGSITLSNVKVNYLNGPNLNNIRHYFLCALTLSKDCTLFLSQVCEADDEGVVNFNINHTFSELPCDFYICVEIYVLKVERQSLSRRLRQRIDRVFISRENANDDTFRRASLFEFWSGTMITIADVNKTKEIVVEILDNRFRKIFVDIAGKVDSSSFSYSSWMSIERHGLFWGNKWCVLRGTHLECFDDAIEDQDSATVPVISVDLKTCVEVTICPPDLQTTDRFLKLTMKNGDFMYNVCMYTKSRYQLTQWKKLRKYVAILTAWKEANCLID